MGMNKIELKSIAWMLTITVTWASFVQSQAQAMLVPTHAVETDSKYDRAADLAVIQKTLESKLIRERLKNLGLHEDEIQVRLSKMSDQEVHQFASQIRAVNPAGFVVWVLTVVLLVVLILFLVKRI